MLLEFSIKNYKSFADEAVFSMMKAPKQSGLDYSLFKKKIKNKNVVSLCSSVIYGPNAAGKSNIIGAIDTFRSIVLKGSVAKAPDEIPSPNVASTFLELIPNSNITSSSPVEFSIKFLESNMVIQYKLSLDLGTFMDMQYDRKVLSEELIVNDTLIFLREEGLHIKNTTPIKKYLANSVKKNPDGAVEIAKNNLNSKELFLTNGFKQIFSPEFANLILDWISKKLIVVYRADSLSLTKRYSQNENAVCVDVTTNKAAEIFGINSNGLGFIADGENKESKLYSIFKDNDKFGKAIPADFYESLGTMRFVNLFPLIVRAIKTGGTLIVDEFDASIHPMALMSIINIFHNDDINVNHAQLIFNTHNPVFLNSNLFRRDEIKFVERDADKNSTIYSLADFGTSGSNPVRKGEDYMKNYFISQYGAIEDIDFSPVFEELLKSEDGEQNG